MATSTIFLRPQHGLLRDVVDEVQLKEYMEGFGEVEDVWIPSKEGDKRYFGFATFKKRDAAEKFVGVSPHQLQNVRILADFREPKRHRHTDSDNALAEVLVPLFKEGEPTELFSWKSYFAPDRVKSVLMQIGEELDPEHLKRVRASRIALFGDERTSAPGLPLVLFHGPPGTGKTHAMKIIAAESGLNPILLDTRKLQEDSYRAPHLWANVLAKISESEGAAILIDEAEILLGRRSVMSNYASVAVKSHQQMLETFLKWADGLQTRTYEDGRAPLICMATNLRDNMDEAVLSRAKVTVEFGLPDSTQCQQWWRKHALQLNSFEVHVLGLLSSVTRLSFRQLWAVAEHMVHHDAQKQKVGCPPGHVGFHDYALQVIREGSHNLSSVATLFYKAQTMLWTATSVMFLIERLLRVAPRARL